MEKRNDKLLNPFEFSINQSPTQFCPIVIFELVNVISADFNEAIHLNIDGVGSYNDQPTFWWMSAVNGVFVRFMEINYDIECVLWKIEALIGVFRL